MAIPTAAEILRDLRTSVQSEVLETDPWTWPNNLVPLLKALAQAIRALYLRIDWSLKQAFVSTATGEYLDYHGIQTGGLVRNPATKAHGNILADGILGTVITDGTVLMRSDGQLYTVIGTYTLITIPTSILIRANDTGEFANTDDGALLSPTTPVAGISTWTVDSSGIIGGLEQEADDSFRQRILYAKANPPHGGSPSEYEEWCQTKSGVTRVFPQRATPQPGSATIYFMMDGIGTGVPTDADVAEMLGILNQLAPEDADVQVKKVILDTVNITITDLVPDTPDMRNKIEDEIRAMFVRKAEPASAIVPFIFSKSWITEAISMAPKWRRSKVTVPADDITISTDGHIPVLGTITFA